MTRLLQDETQTHDSKGLSRPCPRCQEQPVAERVGSYWRVRCPNHSVALVGIVAGHTMKTKTAAFREWDRLMTPPEPPPTEDQLAAQDSMWGVTIEEMKR